MPKEPEDFDCRSVRQVLRLRFKDWMWPTAVIAAFAIPFIGQTNQPYKIHSFTYYLQMFLVPTWLACIVFAGIRWSWVGRMRPPAEPCCAQCGYRLNGHQASHRMAQCPECGTRDHASNTLTARSYLRRSMTGLTLARVLIDLPLLVSMLLPLYVVIAIALMILGVIED